MTEIIPFSDVTESRRAVRADADELGVLLPESVLSKPWRSIRPRSVMRHGCPRYRAGPCLRSLSDFPALGDNQGGTANYFVPEVA